MTTAYQQHVARLRARYDLTGQSFGRLSVIEGAETPPGQVGMFWKCRCECGNECLVRGGDLRRKTNSTVSCGCHSRQRASLMNRKHGHTVGPKISPEYASWRAMLARCRNPKDPNYDNYGGRGITVCDRWLSFENFLADMGLRPNLDHTLDRINNDGSYEPGNCRWAVAVTQANGRRSNVIIEFRGREQTISQWAREVGLTPDCLRQRLHKGWSVERALTEPSLGTKRSGP